MRKFRAILFDMDGVLIDSEFYWTKTEREFAARHHLRFNENYRRQIMALSPLELAETLREKFRLSEPVRQIMAERDRLASVIYQKLAKPLPGAFSLLRKVKKAGLKTAMVSSSPWEWINPILRRFKLRSYFHEIISADDMKDKRGKPHPAIYLFAAKELKVNPKDCLVFEDSVNGVVAAKRAGMFCVAVPDRRWIKDGRGMGRADLIVESLGDVKIFNILNI